MTCPAPFQPSLTFPLEPSLKGFSTVEVIAPAFPPFHLHRCAGSQQNIQPLPRMPPCLPVLYETSEWGYRRGLRGENPAKTSFFPFLCSKYVQSVKRSISLLPTAVNSSSVIRGEPIRMPQTKPSGSAAALPRASLCSGLGQHLAQLSFEDLPALHVAQGSAAISQPWLHPPQLNWLGRLGYLPHTAYLQYSRSVYADCLLVQLCYPKNQYL